MLLTDEQAQEKWCPMSRSAKATDYNVTIGSPAFNRLHLPDVERPTGLPASCYCIGSECAMWRFMDGENNKYISETDEQFCARRRGYCGLAGKP